jgi:D-alanyl-D-alanine carboxypeptidase
LSLDDPAKRWLGDASWFKSLPNSDDILVRHLLSHSSGLGDYSGKLSFNLAMVGRVIRFGSAYFEPEELIGFADKKPLFSAGDGYAYTDVGYLVLGRLIEAATGENYYDLLRERILVPEGLSQIRPQDQSALPYITPGYQGGVSNLKKDGRMKLDPRSEWTGGGLVTNPTMLVQFFAALAEGRIVTSESLTQMLESGWHEPNGPGHHYGFGLFVADNGTWFGHGGRWVGYRTHVTHIVPTGITVAVQTNRDGSVDMIELITRIAELSATTN